MNFYDLHESVRVELHRRVQAGLATATSLARQAGFKQAHISNFLNQRRSLSLDGLDRVLAAQNMTVEEFLPLEVSAAAIPVPVHGDNEIIPVVAVSTALDEPVVRRTGVIETVCVPTALLAECRPRPAEKYQDWDRFVAVRVDAQQAAAMQPLIGDNSIVVLDRHYNSLAPHRGPQKTLYAVRMGRGLALRFVEFDDARLVLRPLSTDFPVQLIPLQPEESPADYLVGRACVIFSQV